MRLTAMIVAALVLGSAAASAHADTYAWTAGQDSGTFTTGAASGDFEGYFLLTDFYFATADAGSVIYTDSHAGRFADGAAFNPTTDSFANGSFGLMYTDTGEFIDNDGNFSVAPLQVGGTVEIDSQVDDSTGYSVAPFEVTSGLPVPPPAAPEPSTWALMCAGVGLAGMALRSRKSVSATVA